MKRKNPNIPKFKNEAAEFIFWNENDSADRIDWSRAKVARFPNLKPSSKTISLRLPEIMLYEIKRLANKQDVPYQSLLKMFIAERLQQELSSRFNRNPMG